MIVYKILRDIFQIIAFLVLSIFIGYAMIVHVTLDPLWQKMIKGFPKWPTWKDILVYIPFALLSIFVLPSRFILGYFLDIWENLLKRAFTLGY
jgi:hypothetical protein